MRSFLDTFTCSLFYVYVCQCMRLLFVVNDLSQVRDKMGEPSERVALSRGGESSPKFTTEHFSLSWLSFAPLSFLSSSFLFILYLSLIVFLFFTFHVSQEKVEKVPGRQPSRRMSGPVVRERNGHVFFVYFSFSFSSIRFSFLCVYLFTYTSFLSLATLFASYRSLPRALDFVSVLFALLCYCPDLRCLLAHNIAWHSLRVLEKEGQSLYPPMFATSSLAESNYQVNQMFKLHPLPNTLWHWCVTLPSNQSTVDNSHILYSALWTIS